MANTATNSSVLSVDDFLKDGRPIAAFDFTDEKVAFVVEAVSAGLFPMRKRDRVDFRDTGCRNHLLLVSKGGGRFFLNMRINGKRRVPKLSDTDDVSVLKSRAKCKRLAKEIRSGRLRHPKIRADFDPADARRAAEIIDALPVLEREIKKLNRERDRVSSDLKARQKRMKRFEWAQNYAVASYNRLSRHVDELRDEFDNAQLKAREAAEKESEKITARAKKVFDSAKAKAKEIIEAAKDQAGNLKISSLYQAKIATPQNGNDLPIPPAHFAPMSAVREQLECVSGIYFAIRNGELAYIGKSKDVGNRWRGHHVLKDDDLVGVVPVPSDQLTDAEYYYIHKFRPSLNREYVWYYRNGGTNKSTVTIGEGIASISPPAVYEAAAGVIALSSSNGGAA